MRVTFSFVESEAEDGEQSQEESNQAFEEVVEDHVKSGEEEQEEANTPEEVNEQQSSDEGKGGEDDSAEEEENSEDKMESNEDKMESNEDKMESSEDEVQDESSEDEVEEAAEQEEIEDNSSEEEVEGKVSGDDDEPFEHVESEEDDDEPFEHVESEEDEPFEHVESEEEEVSMEDHAEAESSSSGEEDDVHQEASTQAMRKRARVSCDVCGKDVTLGTLPHHRRIHFPAEHHCEACNKSFIRVGKLQEHLQTKRHLLIANLSVPFTQTPGRKAKSSQSPKTTSKEEEDEDRVLTAKEKRSAYLTTKVPCEECGKVVSRVNLLAHSKIHAQPAYSCQTCNMNFTLRPNLERHLKCERHLLLANQASKSKKKKA